MTFHSRQYDSKHVSIHFFNVYFHINRHKKAADTASPVNKMLKWWKKKLNLATLVDLVTSH